MPIVKPRSTTYRVLCLLVALALQAIALPALAAHWECADGTPCAANCLMLPGAGGNHGGGIGGCVTAQSCPMCRAGRCCCHRSRTCSLPPPQQSQGLAPRTRVAAGHGACVLRSNPVPAFVASSRAGRAIAGILPSPSTPAAPAAVSGVLCFSVSLRFYPQRFLRPPPGRSPPFIS